MVAHCSRIMNICEFCLGLSCYPVQFSSSYHISGCMLFGCYQIWTIWTTSKYQPINAFEQQHRPADTRWTFSIHFSILRNILWVCQICELFRNMMPKWTAISKNTEMVCRNMRRWKEVARGLTGFEIAFDANFLNFLSLFVFQQHLCFQLYVLFYSVHKLQIPV